MVSLIASQLKKDKKDCNEIIFLYHKECLKLYIIFLFRS